MPAGGVDVRLNGRELDFVVAGGPAGPADAPRAAGAPAPEEAEEEGGIARITLRLPESVKARAEEFAARSGPLAQHLAGQRRPGRDPRQRHQRRHRPVQHPVPRQRPVRGQGARPRQPPDDRLGLTRQLPTTPHTRQARPTGPATGRSRGRTHPGDQGEPMSEHHFETHEPGQPLRRDRQGQRHGHRHRHHRVPRRGRAAATPSGPRRAVRRREISVVAPGSAPASSAATRASTSVVTVPLRQRRWP